MYSDYDYFYDEQLCKKFPQKTEVQEQPKKDNHEDSIENKPNYGSFSKYENDLEKFKIQKDSNINVKELNMKPGQENEKCSITTYSRTW